MSPVLDKCISINGSVVCVWRLYVNALHSMFLVIDIVAFGHQFNPLTVTGGEGKITPRAMFQL